MSSHGTESPERFMQYYARRGHAQRGDEETDAYSDNEGEEDAAPLRRERRERVKLTNAAKNSLVQRATRTPGLQAAHVSVPSIVDSRGRVGVGLTGVNKVGEETMRSARNLNRELESEISMENLQYTNHETQVNVHGLGAKLTINAVRLLNLFTDSKKWTLDLAFGLIFFVLGTCFIYYTLRSLSSYL